METIPFLVIDKLFLTTLLIPLTPSGNIMFRNLNEAIKSSLIQNLASPPLRQTNLSAQRGATSSSFTENGLHHPLQHSYRLLSSFKGIESVKELDGAYQGPLQDTRRRKKRRTRPNSKLCDHNRGPRGLLRRGDR